MARRKGSSVAAPLAGAALLFCATTAQGASCCGGGGASSLILPKAGSDMFGLGLDVEHYDGLWREDGHWVPDPDGSDLNQYRLNVGYAHRFSDHWQGAVNLPYVWNRNAYAGFSRNTEGVGDTTLSLLYETFDGVTCVYKVDSWRDLIPAVYVGTALTVPTGVSPYDNVQDNFDITGRGFYRLDGTVIIDKSVYPWNAGLQLTYGTHLARPVNREYGNYVEPYTKRLGDRASGSLSFGYTWFTEEMATWTATLAWADLWEGEATIDGDRDATSGLRKRSLAATVAWSSAERDWVVKGTWSHSPREDHWGENFPSTDVFSLAFSHVLR